MMRDERPIAILNLSVRACNCLRRAKIDTIQQLLDTSPEELLKTRNLGRKTLEEITAAKEKCIAEQKELKREEEKQLTEEQRPPEMEHLKCGSDEQEEEAQAVLVDERPIEVLNFSVRTYYCLRRAKIDTIQQLLDTSPEELLKTRNLGRKTLEEITAAKEKIIADQRELIKIKEKYETEKLQPTAMKPQKDASDEQEEAALEFLADERPINEFNLSVRALNCLRRAQINTVQQLLDMKPNEFLQLKNLGRKTLEEIVAFQKDHMHAPYPKGKTEKYTDYSAEDQPKT